MDPPSHKSNNLCYDMKYYLKKIRLNWSIDHEQIMLVHKKLK